jgi:polyisoprenyl-phosphate glycosyltransferase
MNPSELLSVVVPAYNEAEALPEFHRRLSAVFDRLDVACEVIYVNDGSSDGTQSLINRLCLEDKRVASIELSRNFGKEVAMTAGLDYAQGDAVVVIDADLQDPPELIAEFVQRWREGYDVVYARRTSRHGETWLKKTTAAAFYRIIQRVSRVQIPADTGDFRLMSRRAIDALLQLREQHRFMNRS